MAAHEGRIRRLEAKVRGQHQTLWQARVARMSEEDLTAEILRLAVKLGYPVEQVGADHAAISAWVNEIYGHDIEAVMALCPEHPTVRTYRGDPAS